MNTAIKDFILKELKWSFSRSSGPGGQHVNTTDSKAQASWSFHQSTAINSKQKHLIEKKLNNYIRRNNTLQISSSRNKRRELNKKDCVEKLFYLLTNIAFKKEKPRLKTRPTRSSVEKRIKAKKTKGDVKKNRQKVKY